MSGRTGPGACPRIAFLRAPDDVRVELVELRKAGVAGGCC